MLSDWDWHRIDVTTGEWWLALLFLVALLVGGLVGYLIGFRAGEKHYVAPPPPDDPILPPPLV